ncbi:hypothetical protein AUEXF2481DRAFT_3715 [Aureobasidium subglaciale EXF-2481]|uniref:Uncharacterized protein n=1 Tax=Aureobasidium subglaciale (strain EXF-2481) TaxID=1043005 RepID=A0A074YH34_AURSE|nr:uncharacterized protein AUEXF2481DRAFT_3715 [Aureobasidium subglaciale EXF-2481]KEQ97040.1 hypothetical protein AUEXF2481DRAFT_3715 [Aureobasidium subglaciale EXF-2481]
MLPPPTILDLDLVDAPLIITRSVAILTVGQLRQQCAILGIVAGKYQKQRLVSMLCKLPTQPVIYDGFGHQDLVDFTLSRELNLSDVAERHLDKFRAKRTELIGIQTRLEALGSQIKAEKPTSREPHFDFLGLPPELRDMVLHLVCISSTTIIHPQTQPAIAGTCRLLRQEALAVYYGCNRFHVFLDNVSRKALSDKDLWLQRISPCHLNSVRSFSFKYVGAVALLDIDFDIRNQTLGIVRFSAFRPSQADQVLSDYLARSRSSWTSPSYVVRLRTYDEWGSNESDRFLHLQGSSSLLAAFKSSILERIEGAKMLATGDTDAETARIANWKRLEVEWTARSGFSGPSIERIMEMLVENIPDIKNLWVHDFVD